VVLATLEAPSQQLRVTHWSSRLLGDQLGISHVWVSKISMRSTGPKPTPSTGAV
jgi:hypothetical protein